MPTIEIPFIELPTEDGIPLESNWHRIEMNLLIDSVHYHWRGRDDYFAGGNMFIYYSIDQVRNRDYRGPDFFVVKDVDDPRDRAAWIVWEEYGQYPNLIVELASPSTIDIDLGDKKKLYEQVFRMPEYYCYDPGGELWGWRLVSGRYEEIAPNERGWLWSEELGLWLGAWQGEFQRVKATWLRFYDAKNQLVYSLAEAEARHAKSETQRAETEARRAEAAEAEVARLRARLAELGVTNGDQSPG